MSRLKPHILQAINRPEFRRQIADATGRDDKTISNALRHNKHQSVLTQINALYCIAGLLKIANIRELIDLE